MSAGDAHVNDDGSLYIRANLEIPSDEIELRVTTSGGPGGQHANRSLTRVVASFRIEDSTMLSDADRALLLGKIGTVVQSSASRFRSQGQNRSAALEQLAQKILVAITRQPPRRAEGVAVPSPGYEPSSHQPDESSNPSWAWSRDAAVDG
jgi:ribosome-associated protein